MGAVAFASAWLLSQCFGREVETEAPRLPCLSHTKSKGTWKAERKMSSRVWLPSAQTRGRRMETGSDEEKEDTLNIHVFPACNSKSIRHIHNQYLLNKKN